MWGSIAPSLALNGPDQCYPPDSPELGNLAGYSDLSNSSVCFQLMQGSVREQP